MHKDNLKSARPNRTITLPFDQDTYSETEEDAFQFRLFIDDMAAEAPELFPPEISEGYQMKDRRFSKKLSVYIRRITIGKHSYTIHPSFVMPYMTAMTSDADPALFLRKFDVPFWALARVFGKDHMHWQRMEQALGRNSVVGTTVKVPENLPAHIGADEKHSSIMGDKCYLATTAAEECFMGVSVAENAGDDALEKAYGVFREESRDVDPEYSPETATTDGWKATRNAFLRLFPMITLILCFLHVYIGIRDRARKKFAEIFQVVSSKLWHCYDACSKASFSQRVRRFYEWALKASIPPVIFDKIEKMYKNLASYSAAYDFPGAFRTSNMLDRLMRKMDRHLFNTQYFHGSLFSAELGIRGWALIQNFAPSNPITQKKYNDGFQSPAERLNKFRYNDNWLQNLLISASLGGYRKPPPNPL